MKVVVPVGAVTGVMAIAAILFVNDEYGIGFLFLGVTTIFFVIIPSI
jgi:hypothetical protein